MDKHDPHRRRSGRKMREGHGGLIDTSFQRPQRQATPPPRAERAKCSDGY